MRSLANENIETANSLEVDSIEYDVQCAMEGLLAALRIDTEQDHNTRNTARRVAKMYVREVLKGRFTPEPEVTVFPNTKGLDELYVTGPITIRSMCSHHFAPIVGQAWVGLIPGDKLIGLSKFNRLVEWIFARPQIQEEATVQLADLLEKKCEPKGLGLVVRAKHMCMTWRGVQEHDNAVMTTSVMRGLLLTNGTARSEFLSFVK